MKNQFFDMDRFLLILKRDLNESAKPMIIAILTICGTLLIFNLLQILTSEIGVNGFHSGTFIVSTTIMMLVGVSLSFAELRHTSSKVHYLTIPASTFEKLFSKWVIYAIAVPLVFYLCFFSVGALSTWFIKLSARNIMPMIWPSLSEYLSMGSIWMVQSIFLAGAIYFPKNSFIKTLGILIVLSLLYAFLSFGMLYLLLHENQTQHLSGFNLNLNDIPWPGSTKLIVQLLVFCFFMLLSYFKLKEEEV